MKLSDPEPQKLTKTLRRTMLGCGMVTCGMVTCGMVTCGMVTCGMVICGGALCVYTFQNLDIFYHRYIEGVIGALSIPKF